MPVELVEVDYLKPDTRFRPYQVDALRRDELRERFMNWMKERHGIVVYQNSQMDSSSCGDTTFVPRMVDTNEAGMQPAMKWLHDLPSQRQYPIDWIQPQPTEEENRQLLNRCFYFEHRNKRLRLFSETPAASKWPDVENLVTGQFSLPIFDEDKQVSLASIDVCHWFEDPEGVWVSRIYTPPKYRQQGYCRRGMTRLCAEADRLQVRLYIAPNSYEDNVVYMNNQQLMAWWKRLGFQRAFGRGRLMVRYPR